MLKRSQDLASEFVMWQSDGYGKFDRRRVEYSDPRCHIDAAISSTKSLCLQVAKRMNPNVDSLHAGIAEIAMEADEFELGEGLILRKTFAHFMAPFLMAFAPRDEDGTHPGPWGAVSDGLNDIHIELYVPASFQNPEFFDRLNTVGGLRP